MIHTALWQPELEQLNSSQMALFIMQVNKKYNLALKDYASLHQWSIDYSADFWSELWSFANVVGDAGSIVIKHPNKMPGAEFFPEAQLNFAENLLALSERHPNGDALVFRGEDKVRAQLTWQQLQAAVSVFSQALKAEGVVAGDRVAAFMPNLPETIIAMLATTSIGAVWCSCSPDFGVQGVVDRFGQIEPKILLACDGYFYNGKSIDNLPKLSDIVSQLPSVKKVVLVPYLRNGLNQAANVAIDFSALDNTQLYDDWLAPFKPQLLSFERFSFSHPVFILFSSGTTGQPKCIVHSAGGTLLQHLKEHQLHGDIHYGDRLFYFTTCTWMMWNWLVSALASGATLLLFDGSPFYPNNEVLLDFAEQEACTHFGTSAKYLETLSKRELVPNQTHNFDALRMLFSTGSPLLPESYDYVYQSIKSSVYLASIAGGTDIVSCFVLGAPLQAIYRGEIPCRGLGMAVEVWNDEGKPVIGQKGELVCTQPFPSMPIGFWQDDDGQRYQDAYFSLYENVWAQGDYAELTPRGGVIIYGRSDATLNPGGVRIGTAEIYRQIESFSQVVSSVVIGQPWQGDERVILFVVLTHGELLSDTLIADIKKRIRSGASPRHVPALIVQVSDIPVTKLGKLAELAVKQCIEGRTIKNVTALANPESLTLFSAAMLA